MSLPKLPERVDRFNKSLGPSGRRKKDLAPIFVAAPSKVKTPWHGLHALWMFAANL